MFRVGVLAFTALLASFSFARAIKSDYREVRGIKYPEFGENGRRPVYSRTLSPRDSSEPLPGYSELVEYVLPSPNQLDAGSCLYMSLTGIAEWWLARRSPQVSRASEGPLDLSERFLMNLADRASSNNNVIKNWKTDSILAFNKGGRAALNRDYPFTMGWYKSGENGYEKAVANSAGAEYGPSFNWIDDLDSYRGIGVLLPRFRRDVLFADPESNQWNVGVMPANIVETVKEALRRNQAPVHVLYNHYGYWHANIVLGYDDELKREGCPFVTRFREQQANEAKKLRQEAQRTNDPKQRETLLARATKFEGTVRKFDASWRARGGCRGQGAFYVRDSIYDDPNAPAYDYDRLKKGEEEPYSKRIVMLEYEWLQHMANHAIQILIQ